MNDQLRKLQLTQIGILKVIDQICRKHGIQYSLYAGTLLGAVRHQGFIPWDDDLDICMARDDYNRFIEIWDTVPHDGFILQNKENSPAFTQSFTKIRKDHTTFLQDEREIGLYHTGIFVDIFPVDRLPAGKLAQIQFYWNVMQYQLFTREFIPSKANGIVKLISELFLNAVPVGKREQKRKKLLAKITAHNNNPSLQAVSIETIESMKQHHSPYMFDEYVELSFDSEAFMCYAGWDNHLKVKYGDYMQLPPESERVWKHHPILIDFEHNYEELPKEMKIK